LLILKLNSNRERDQEHIKRLNDAGLITPEVKREIPTELNPILEEILARHTAEKAENKPEPI
jgi:argininosuccinate lyase